MSRKLEDSTLSGQLIALTRKYSYLRKKGAFVTDYKENKQFFKSIRWMLKKQDELQRCYALLTGAYGTWVQWQICVYERCHDQVGNGFNAWVYPDYLNAIGVKYALNDDVKDLMQPMHFGKAQVTKEEAINTIPITLAYLRDTEEKMKQRVIVRANNPATMLELARSRNPAVKISPSFAVHIKGHDHPDYIWNGAFTTYSATPSITGKDIPSLQESMLKALDMRDLVAENLLYEDFSDPYKNWLLVCMSQTYYLLRMFRHHIDTMMFFYVKVFREEHPHLIFNGASKIAANDCRIGKMEDDITYYAGTSVQRFVKFKDLKLDNLLPRVADGRVTITTPKTGLVVKGFDKKTVASLSRGKTREWRIGAEEAEKDPLIMAIKPRLIKVY